MSSSVLQVVDGEGEFNASGVNDFMRNEGVENSGVDYTIVAIMGPQSSGKSTLLNHLVSSLGKLVFLFCFRQSLRNQFTPLL